MWQLIRKALELVDRKLDYAPVAQWIEQVASNHQVGGSNPPGRARYITSREMAENIREFQFMISPHEGGDFDEDAIDRILDTFIDAVVKEGYSAGGGVGPPPPEDRICQWCDGDGVRGPIPEARKCPTCGGSGEVDPNSMSKEEWEETYGEAPVAQRKERSVPTREAAGSIPAGGANSEEES